jgi:anti-sigma factor RsiW
MEHARVQEYLDGELPQTEREQVERHLMACRSCQNELAWLKVTARMIAEESEPAIPERLSELKQRIMNRYDAMLQMKQPEAENLKTRTWVTEGTRFEPRSAGKSDDWRRLSRRNDVGRDEAFQEADRLAREINVELPAELKSVAQKMRKAERESE